LINTNYDMLLSNMPSHRVAEDAATTPSGGTIVKKGEDGF
jgi:hypothetical protein